MIDEPAVEPNPFSSSEPQDDKTPGSDDRKARRGARLAPNEPLWRDAPLARRDVAKPAGPAALPPAGAALWQLPGIARPVPSPAPARASMTAPATVTALNAEYGMPAGIEPPAAWRLRADPDSAPADDFGSEAARDDTAISLPRSLMEILGLEAENAAPEPAAQRFGAPLSADRAESGDARDGDLPQDSDAFDGADGLAIAVQNALRSVYDEEVAAAGQHPADDGDTDIADGDPYDASGLPLEPLDLSAFAAEDETDSDDGDGFDRETRRFHAETAAAIMTSLASSEPDMRGLGEAAQSPAEDETAESPATRRQLPQDEARVDAAYHRGAALRAGSRGPLPPLPLPPANDAAAIILSQPLPAAITRPPPAAPFFSVADIQQEAKPFAFPAGANLESGRTLVPLGMQDDDAQALGAMDSGRLLGAAGLGLIGGIAVAGVLAVFVFNSFVSDEGTPGEPASVTAATGLERPAELPAAPAASSPAAPQLALAEPEPPAVPALTPALEVQAVEVDNGATAPLRIATAANAPQIDRNALVAITGLPDGARLSSGVEVAVGDWLLPPARLSGLTVSAPPGDQALAITAEATVVQRDGRTPLSEPAQFALSWRAKPAPVTPPAALAAVAPQPSAAPARADDGGGLVRDGVALMRNGDFVGARERLSRAAELGEERALLLLGDTYEPSRFESGRVSSGRANPAEAFMWYKRALDAGEPAAEGRIEGLKRFLLR